MQVYKLARQSRHIQARPSLLLPDSRYHLKTSFQRRAAVLCGVGVLTGHHGCAIPPRRAQLEAGSCSRRERQQQTSEGLLTVCKGTASPSRSGGLLKTELSFTDSHAGQKQLKPHAVNTMKASCCTYVYCSAPLTYRTWLGYGRTRPPQRHSAKLQPGLAPSGSLSPPPFDLPL